MYQIKLTYSSIDRLFYVYLLENGKEIREKYFQTESKAREFIKKVSGGN
jgi:hypothetical protein